MIGSQKQDRRRATLEARVAYWEKRVQEDTSLQPQLDHHREQLERFNAVYDRSQYDTPEGEST
jgi:hypothetical protein